MMLHVSRPGPAVYSPAVDASAGRTHEEFYVRVRAAGVPGRVRPRSILRLALPVEGSQIVGIRQGRDAVAVRPEEARRVDVRRPPEAFGRRGESHLLLLPTLHAPVVCGLGRLPRKLPQREALAALTSSASIFS